MEPDARLEDAEATASGTVDTLRHLLSSLGSFLNTAAGSAAAEASTGARSLPALSQALRRLWFQTPVGATWDSKEQAVWLCKLLAVKEGNKSGLLSFYGAGLLVSEGLIGFAEHALAEKDLAPDAAWLSMAVTVQAHLQGHHWEQLQRWPADRRCGGGSDPLLSADRLPTSVKRSLDLEGAKLSKTQAAGLAAAMILPGAMTIGMGGLGVMMLVKSARERTRSSGDPSEETAKGGDKWQRIQAACLRHAHELLRRKTCPIEVRYQLANEGDNSPKSIRVSLYSTGDMICAVPVGGMSMNGTGGDGTCLLRPGESFALRPPSSADNFRLRVYRPGTIFDEMLHDGIEVCRGDRLEIEPCANGRQVRCFAQPLRGVAAWEG